jgi:hypothetical protein
MAASQVVLRGPSGAHHARATLSVDHRSAGSALDATFVVAVALPRWSEQGVWTVESVTLIDQVGNQQTSTAPGVTFTQTGIGDTAAPQFRAFSLSTTTVDVRTAAASIVMRSRIVDDRSGAADGIGDSSSSVVFTSPSGRQRLTAPFGAAQRVGGDNLDGDYSVSATVPAHAEPGVWTMSDAWPIDRAANVGHLATSDWAAKSYDGSFTVVSDTPPDTGPTVAPAPTTTTVTSVSEFTSTTSIDAGTTTTLGPEATTTTIAPEATTTTIDPEGTTVPADETSTVVDEETTTTAPGEETTITAPDEETTTVPDEATTIADETTTTVDPEGTTTTSDTVEPESHRPPSVHTSQANGYWFASATGRVVGFGGAATTSAPAIAGLGGGWPDRVVGIAGTPSGKGYWLATARGDVRAFGDARSRGSMRGHPLARPIVGIAGTPSGKGYWLVATDGGIFGFGDAPFYGSTGAIHLNQPIVGMTSTPSGRGYWFVAADGGLFSYGDARFYGSMGATRLNQPVVGMTAAPKARGYWMVSRDGGIFSFGAARFYGSTGALHLNQPIVGMAASPTARGYWFVAADGGVFGFGDAHFFGSLAGPAGQSARPVVGMAIRVS